MRNHARVYVPHKAHHDYRPAERFGELVFLTEGNLKGLGTNTLFMEIRESLKDAEAQDYILVSGLAIVCTLVSGEMAAKFGRLNLLIYNGRGYEERTIVLDRQ